MLAQAATGATEIDPESASGTTRHTRSLTILANRLPVRSTDRGWEVSPGGLVSALTPVLRRSGGQWIGWSGRLGEAGGPFSVDGLDLVDIPLTEAEFDAYYCHCANEILWPLFHDGVRPPHYNDEAWDAYREVNHRFARAAADVTPRGGAVWIHDYHLLLAPGMLRALRPDVRIGLFLHIPVPPVELFATLPWREELVAALSETDLIGTQTESDARHLREALLKPGLASESAPSRLESVEIAGFPISIDSARFVEAARSADDNGQTAETRREIGAGRTIFLGVDRLDYTKGIDRRLEAFELALERGEIDADKACFVQIAVPSRDRVAEYQEMSERVDELVGRINGRFGGFGAQVVRYCKDSVAFGELVPLYRVADVMVVTPLRDGMNLVAKEYAATRYDGSGELILSEFAGAAHELADATLVNPHDVNGVSEAMVEAYQRHRRGDAAPGTMRLHRHVCRHDVHAWSASFLKRLSGAGAGAASR